MRPVVLVVLETPRTAPELLAAAARLAALIGGAMVEALAVLSPPASRIMPSEEVLTRQRETELRAVETRRVAALRQVFDFSPGHAQARWLEIEAEEAAALRECGRRADALVLSRPAGGERHLLHAALFGTGRPVLVVPPGFAGSFGARVAIAWRDDPHAARAVLSALRAAARPEQVFVLAGMRPGMHAVLPPILVEHEVAAELHELPVPHAGLGAALLERAQELGADLLVMGAYSHSPWREAVLGGVTRYVLDHATLPLLMRH